jgi:hypothetical protein
MTDKQQPDPLALADEAWNFDCSKYRGARHANAAMMGKMQDCADMIRKLHAELERLALYKSLADEYGLSIFPDIAEMTAELKALRAGYIAARLEIESLKAQLAAPAAVEGPSDLRTRCEEILAWRKTGVLPGEALRTLAREKYGDEYDAIQRAERDTETEALNFVVAAPTTQPAPQQEVQEPVAWQSRIRQTWGGDTTPWSPWELCTKGQAEDYWKMPLLHDWAYEARALYTAPQPAPATQQAGEVAEGFFLLLPQRPRPDAPAGTAGLHWDAYSGAQMLAYGRDCSDAAIAAFQPSPAAQGDVLSDDAVRVPLDSLHADAAYLIGRLREGSMPYARVIEIIRERIDAAKATNGGNK